MQSKFLRFGIISLVSIILYSCNNKSDKKVTKADTASQVPDAVPPTSGPPRLFCVDKGLDSNDTPHADVYLYLNGNESKLTSINACSEISKEDYKAFEIPENALYAIGGFWAGLGTYFYLIEKDGKFVVFEGFTEEGQRGYHWKEWKSE